MRKIFAGSRSLLVIAALVMIAAMSTTSTAKASSSPTGGRAASTVGSHSPATPAGQCTFVPSLTCQSTDPVVALDIYYYGDSADCIFDWDVNWGDGTSTPNLEVDGPSDGYRLLAQHTYLTPETYTIAVTGLVPVGNCAANAFTATFTLTSPTPPPNPAINGKACVFDAPSGVTSVFGHDIFGHVGWGFQLPSGNWEFGANEGPGNLDISKTWYATGTFQQMLSAFRDKGRHHSLTYYKTYKCATVNTTGAKIGQAGTTVGKEFNELYFIPGRDCESQVYNVLAAYGVGHLPSDTSIHYWPSPNNWFNHLSSAGFGNAKRL